MNSQKSLWASLLGSVLALYILQNVTADNKANTQTDYFIAVEEPSLLIKLDYEVLVETPHSPQLHSAEHSHRKTYAIEMPDGMTEALEFFTAVIALIGTCMSLRSR